MLVLVVDVLSLSCFSPVGTSTVVSIGRTVFSGVATVAFVVVVGVVVVVNNNGDDDDDEDDMTSGLALLDVVVSTGVGTTSGGKKPTLAVAECRCATSKTDDNDANCCINGTSVASKARNKQNSSRPVLAMVIEKGGSCLCDCRRRPRCRGLSCGEARNIWMDFSISLTQEKEVGLCELLDGRDCREYRQFG